MMIDNGDANSAVSGVEETSFMVIIVAALTDELLNNLVSVESVYFLRFATGPPA